MESKGERAARLRLEERVVRLEVELRSLRASVERRAREIRRVDERLPVEPVRPGI